MYINLQNVTNEHAMLNPPAICFDNKKQLEK